MLRRRHVWCAIDFLSVAGLCGRWRKQNCEENVTTYALIRSCALCACTGVAICMYNTHVRVARMHVHHCKYFYIMHVYVYGIAGSLCRHCPGDLWGPRARTAAQGRPPHRSPCLGALTCAGLIKWATLRPDLACRTVYMHIRWGHACNVWYNAFDASCSTCTCAHMYVVTFPRSSKNANNIKKMSLLPKNW